MPATEIRERIAAHAAEGKSLAIRGGGSKLFYGAKEQGDLLDMRGFSGIIDYQPKELVLTVRAGTPLSVVEAALMEAGQMLPFEPPNFGAGSMSAATIGGCVAAGLSGPRRPYAGAVRDFVLGTRIIDGIGQDLRFGGRVIKNVAGYDVSRLMCGAMGTLGVLLEVSFKTLPRPAAEATLAFELDEATAIRRFNEWAGQPLPLSGAAWHGGKDEGRAVLRLSGAAAGVAAARAKLGGELVAENAAQAYWRDLNEQRAAFFQGGEALWRLSVPPTAPPLDFGTPQWIDWGGGLRWVRGGSAQAMCSAAESVGGHATLFRGGDKRKGVFHPLHPRPWPSCIETSSRPLTRRAS
jgi:glycolate oxidase FAD binding subunit